MPLTSKWTAAARDYRVAILVLVAGILISSVVAHRFWRRSLELDAQRFELAVEEAVRRIETAMESVQIGLQMLGDAVGARSEFTEGHWRLQVDRLGWNIDYPGVLEVGLAQNVCTNWPHEFEAVMTDDFRSTNSAVRHRASAALSFLQKQPVETVPVFRYFPRSADHRPAKPVPIIDDGDVIRHALIRQWPSMTGKRIIATKTNGSMLWGTTMVLGVPTEELAHRWTKRISSFQNARDHTGNNDVWNRMNAFMKQRWGNYFVYASVDWQMLYDHWGSLKDPNLNLDLFASNALDSEARVATSTPIEKLPSRFTTNVLVRVYGDRWKLAARSTPLFETQSTGYRSWIALGGGILLSGLVSALLGVQISARLRQERISMALAAAREERVRLDRDLHDGAIQTLYALQLGCNQLERDFAENEAVLKRVGNVRQTLQSVITELRGFLIRQAPESSRLSNLESVIHSMIQILKQGLPPDVSLDVSCQPGSDDDLTQEQLVELAKIAREAVSNSIRHSGARRIVIATRSHSGHFELEIRDDGKGMGPFSNEGKGHGLTSMKTRAKEMGGTFEFTSHPGAGTQVRVNLQTYEPSDSNSDRR